MQNELLHITKNNGKRFAMSSLQLFAKYYLMDIWKFYELIVNLQDRDREREKDRNEIKLQRME